MTAGVEPDLLAICDVCLQPIADGEGHVWVDPNAADEAARSLPAAGGPIDLGEFLDSGVDDTPWRTTHTSCQDIPAWAYTIAVERIRTWPAYLHWCAHLMGKNWTDGTDWQEFVLRSLEPERADATCCDATLFVHRLPATAPLGGGDCQRSPVDPPGRGSAS